MKVPLLNFVGGPGTPLLNFEGGPGVPLLNLRGVPGPTFKLWGGSRVSVPRVPWSRVPGSWSHFYTIPCFLFYWRYCTWRRFWRFTRNDKLVLPVICWALVITLVEYFLQASKYFFISYFMLKEDGWINIYFKNIEYKSGWACANLCSWKTVLHTWFC